ncbi:MAG: CbiX/SirB N-terminal domain-containing protein [Betaproteobacteria bacterium]|jgi:sirohydrochlorin cobaltochelatase
MTEPAAFLLYAHGARDPDWATPIRAIAQRLRDRAPGRLVEAAFLEHMAPGMDDAMARLVAAGARRVTIVPLFMGRGGHLKKDLPVAVEACRQAHPGVDIRVSPALGEDAALVDAIVTWVLSGDAAPLS